MGVPWIHAGGADCLYLLFGKLGSREAAPAFPKALELLIFLGADEVAGDPAVARYGDGLALGPASGSARSCA